MEFTTSKLGKKYDRKQIESLDKQYHKELQLMYKGKTCADCGAKNPSWATLKRTTFVCTSCAQKLREDAANKIKSCMGSYLWHPDEMELMRSASEQEPVKLEQKLINL